MLELVELFLFVGQGLVGFAYGLGCACYGIGALGQFGISAIPLGGGIGLFLGQRLHLAANVRKFFLRVRLFAFALVLRGERWRHDDEARRDGERREKSKDRTGKVAHGGIIPEL